MMACPGDMVLGLWLSGGLPEAWAAEVTGHVPHCPHCRGWLDSHTEHRELRRAADGARELPAEPEGGLQQFLQRLRGLSPLPAGDTPPPAAGPTLTWMEPPTRPGDVGTLGPYRLEQEVGRGGMGIVFRAFDPALQRTVAVKVLRPELDDPAARARLVREARLAARLCHDHVVSVYAVVDPPGGQPYLVMEYVPGPTLKAVLRQRGPLPPAEAAALIAQVADGLAAAHAAGFIHRDVKPGNVLLDPATGRARLTDFGLARPTADAAGATRSSPVAGTPEYMSPEQAQGGAALDGRTDVYGLGAALYEALTGTAPFQGTLARVLEQVVHDEPRPPRRLNEAVPRDLETVCLKALAKEPNRRYPTAAALADDLRRFLKGELIRARPAGRAERLWRWCRRNPRVAFLSAALLLALVAGVIGVSWQYARTVAQRDEARRQQARAQVAFRRARDTVDAYLTGVSDDPDLKARPLEPLRRKLLQKARDYYEHFVVESPDDPDLVLELARAEGRLGDIVGELESWPRAVPYYLRQQETCRRLLRERPGDVECRRELAWCCRTLGVACYYAGEVAAALDEFQKARSLHEGLVREHPDDAEDLHQLLKTLNNLGRVLQIARRRDEAEEAYRACRAAYDRWCAVHPPESRHDSLLTLLLANWSSLCGETGRPQLRLEKLQEAIAAGERVARAAPGDVVARVGLHSALLELGNLHLQGGRVEDAVAALERARAVGEGLVRDHPAGPEYQAAVAEAWYALGQARQRQGHTGEARTAYEHAVEIHQRRARDFPEDRINWYELGQSQTTLGQLLQGAGEWPAALELYGGAIDRWERAFPPAKRPESAQSNLSHFYFGKGVALVGLGRFAEAERALDQALALGRPGDRKAIEALRAYAAAQRKAPDLTPTRHREDFRRLLADIQAGRLPSSK